MCLKKCVFTFGFITSPGGTELDLRLLPTESESQPLFISIKRLKSPEKRLAGMAAISVIGQAWQVRVAGQVQKLKSTNHEKYFSSYSQ